MTEKPQSAEIIPEEWKENMRLGIEDVIANYEIFEMISFDPFSLTAVSDHRYWDKITDQERKWILDELFYKNSFDRQNNVFIGNYMFTAPDDPETTWKGVATVQIFETKRSKLEGMYLHEISRPGCVIEYIVASREFRF